MPNYIVRANQSMSDVVICTIGSMQGAMQFCMDNNVALSDTPVAGSSMVVSAAAIAAAGSAGVSVLGYYAANGVVAANLNAPAPVPVLTDDGDELDTDSGDGILVD